MEADTWNCCSICEMCYKNLAGNTNLPADTRGQVFHNQAVFRAHWRRVSTVKKKGEGRGGLITWSILLWHADCRGLFVNDEANSGQGL